MSLFRSGLAIRHLTRQSYIDYTLAIRAIGLTEKLKTSTVLGNNQSIKSFTQQRSSRTGANHANDLTLGPKANRMTDTKIDIKDNKPCDLHQKLPDTAME